MDFDRGYSAQAQKLLPLDATQWVYGDPPWNVKARFSLNETAPRSYTQGRHHIS